MLVKGGTDIYFVEGHLTNCLPIPVTCSQVLFLTWKCPSLMLIDMINYSSRGFACGGRKGKLKLHFAWDLELCINIASIAQIIWLFAWILVRFLCVFYISCDLGETSISNIPIRYWILKLCNVFFIDHDPAKTYIWRIYNIFSHWLRFC